MQAGLDIQASSTNREKAYYREERDKEGAEDWARKSLPEKEIRVPHRQVHF